MNTLPPFTQFPQGFPSFPDKVAGQGLQLGDDANHRHLRDVAVHVCVNEVEDTPQPETSMASQGPKVSSWLELVNPS